MIPYPARTMDAVATLRCREAPQPRILEAPHAHPLGPLSRMAPTRARRVGAAGILILAVLATACGRAQRHVIREPYKVEIPIVVCPRLDPQLLEEVRVPEPPEPMTYGALVEWTADLLQVIARLTADRRAVASSLPARCVGASP